VIAESNTASKQASRAPLVVGHRRLLLPPQWHNFHYQLSFMLACHAI